MRLTWNCRLGKETPLCVGRKMPLAMGCSCDDARTNSNI